MEGNAYRQPPVFVNDVLASLTVGLLTPDKLT